MGENSRSREVTNPGPGGLLVEAIADAVFLRVESLLHLPQRLFDLERAAEYLGMTPDGLSHKAGVEIPVVKLDRKLRFDVRDLDKCIDRAKREGG